MPLLEIIIGFFVCCLIAGLDRVYDLSGRARSWFGNMVDDEMEVELLYDQLLRIRLFRRYDLTSEQLERVELLCKKALLIHRPDHALYRYRFEPLQRVSLSQWREDAKGFLKSLETYENAA